LFSRIFVVVGCVHLPGIVPVITLRILRSTAPVNGNFTELPNRGAMTAAGHDSGVALVKRRN
jgi:hypothetical protein